MFGKDYVIHSSEELKSIRRAAQAAAVVRDRLPKMVQPGMTTLAVNELAGRIIAELGGQCAFLGYHGFPANICVSVNDEVVHGIGSVNRILDENDIVSVDIGVTLDGGIGDTATTFTLNEQCSGEISHLLKYTHKALLKGIEQAVVGNHVRDISAAIEKVARKAGLGIVREYVGHGCGIKLHEPPEVPNFVCAHRGPKLRPGMVLAIEPMLSLGNGRVLTEKDHWTVRTIDGSWSAHFEHMVLITEKKPEILTWPKMM